MSRVLCFKQLGKTLWLTLKDEVFEYKVDFKNQEMIWIPKYKSEKYFDKLYLKSLLP